MGKNIYINVTKIIATNGYIGIYYINDNYVLTGKHGNDLTKHELKYDGNGNIYFSVFGVKYYLSDFIRVDFMQNIN